MKCVRIGLMVGVSMMVACMTTAQGLTVQGAQTGRLGVTDARLGDDWATVMPTASAAHGDASCEARKIGGKLSRRAFLMESCRFEPISDVLEGAPVSELVLHFIDRRLLRIDVATARLDREQVLALVDALESRFGQPDEIRADTVSSDGSEGETLTVWRSGDDAMALRRFIDAGEDTRLELHMQDVNAAEQTAALSAW